MSNSWRDAGDFKRKAGMPIEMGTGVRLGCLVCIALVLTGKEACGEELLKSITSSRYL